MINFSKPMELMSKAAENCLDESIVMMMANDKLTKRSEYVTARKVIGLRFPMDLPLNS